MTSRRHFISTAAGLAVTAAASSPSVFSAESTMTEKLPETVFERGGPNPYGKFFTGQTYLHMLSASDAVFNCPVGNVTFEPGARTHWHKHSGGQILLVTAGLGRYCERGGKIRVLRPGDVVRIAPGVEHWHGADARTGLVHISIETNASGSKTDWLDPVVDADYERF